MEETIQKILCNLFIRLLDEKIVRNISKEIETLLPDAKRLLVAEVVTRIRSLLLEDVPKALITVTLLCNGCPTLRNSLGVCLGEILLACTERIHISHIEEFNKRSQFHVAVKALYGILQYIFPQNFLLLERPEITRLLEKMYLSLLLAMTSDKLPSDCALITATSLNIILVYLKRHNEKLEFFNVLSTVNKIQMNEIKKDDKYSIGELLKFHHESMNLRSMKCVQPSRAIVLILHGLFNSGVQWIYEGVNWDEVNTVRKALIQENHKNHHCDLRPESARCVVLPLTQVQKQNEYDGREDENIFLYDIYFLIRSLCRGATSYTFQAFQVLHMWLSSLRKLGDKMQESLAGVLEQEATGLHQEYIKNIHPSEKWIFSIQSSRQNTVFHLLNSNWENPAKGVSDIVYTCMTELLELHEDRLPGQAKVLATDILGAVVSFAAWSSKSTYPPLALAISYVGAQETLLLHPTLPAGLATSLSVNHLAPAGAAVYKIILRQLSSSIWSQYFFTIVCEALHGNRLTQQHMVSLWLPPTLHHYPSIYLNLLSSCQDTTAGWVARMAILRVARSFGIFGLKDHSTVQSQRLITFQTQKSTNEDLVHNNENEFNEITVLPVMLYIQSALNHINETVRGEALSLLCHTQKASQPVSLEESICIKTFFKFNMNIDSTPFRQGIIKCYKALVIRLRDASAAELKKLSFKIQTSSDCSPEFMKNFKASPVLKINIELLVWFIKFFHYNLTPDGNYQRRILSLQLYKETLLTFYEKKSSFSYSLAKRYMPVCAYINLTSKSVACLENERENQPVTNLTLSWTQEMLYFSCLDEMDDIREEVENTLEILESSMNISCITAEEWLRHGLTLCNSAKVSDCESGAVLLKIMSSSCYNSNHDISSMLKNMESSFESESMIDFLFCYIERQFKEAQKNLLKAARCTPIHGPLMALGRCLCEGTQAEALPSKEMQHFVERLTNLMVQIVEFMLSKLACASPNGSAIAPSFAEMGAAVELIIQECGGNLEGPSEREASSSHDRHEDIPENSVDDDDEDGSLCEDHLLIVACCWQTLKTCCTVSSMCVSRWLNSVREDQIEQLLRAVVVRVLTGTRHKGAMEGARTAYSQLCHVLLTTDSKIGQLVYKQVQEILDQLKSGARTSITRRAAGMAMMIQAACGAAPRTNAALVNDTIINLVNIAKTEYEEKSTTDSPPVLALHVLHSLVIHAPLAHHLLHHMPPITATCLQAFTHDSWALRNAALQLYGAVVPRMVGQKKVRDESSTLNSLTAPEFLFRHPNLAESLLQLLTSSCKRLTCDKDIKEKIVHSKERISIKMSSSLVPVLSLLARLSPGTGLQQNKELNDTLGKFCEVTNRLLGSPVYTIRRLASLAIVALTPIEQAHCCINDILNILKIPELTNTNRIHGNLFTLKSFLQTYPKLASDQQLKNSVVASLGWLLEPNNKCSIIADLAVNILSLLQVNITTNPKPSDSFQPGAPEYLHNFTMMITEQNFHDVLEKILSEHDLEEKIEQLVVNLKIQTNSSSICKFEKLLWQRLEQRTSTRRSLLGVMKMLCVILDENASLNFGPSEKCVENLLILLKGRYGAKATSLALVIVAHLFKKLNDDLWPGSKMKMALLFAFSDIISLYSAPTSTEDYRLAASIALKISLKTLLYSLKDICTANKEHIIVACTELLQDEDSDIRDSACHIVLSLSNTNYHTSTMNILEKGLSNECCSWQLLSQDLLHPNLALLEFAKYIVRKCIHTSDWSTFRVIWRLCSGQYNDDFLSLNKSLPNSKSSLFQSHTMNLYKEPKQLSYTMAKAMLDTLKESHKNVSQNTVPQWLQEEGDTLNKKGKILSKLVFQHPHLYNQKQLLSVTCTYIIASKTLLSIGNIFNVPINLEYSLAWNPSHFCAVAIQR
nr:thyroid adenoma-associated protein homolog [Procambarus clarkii]